MLLWYTHTHTQEKTFITHTTIFQIRINTLLIYIFPEAITYVFFSFLFLQRNIFHHLVIHVVIIFLPYQFGAIFFVFLITRTIDSVPVKYHEPRTAAVAPYNKKVGKKIVKRITIRK